MPPILRRIVYVTAYEGLAILFSALIFVVLGHEEGSAGIAAVVASAVAVAWNFVFTTLFEWWEKRNPVKGRSATRRMAHAVLFEGGLAVVLTPVLALTLGVPLLEAFITNLGLLVYFLVYTYLFNLAFDTLFGLPESARPKPVE
ncbi:PACE efflux transporter [Pseudomonas sp. R2.Fl]|nr:PACE efflux transporter [Pseudomonas sp. R2.Fl]